MGKMSKRKGSGFENVIAKRIRAVFLPGIDAKTAYNLVHRTPLSGGHVERGDLICKPPVLKYFPWFVECRNRENWTWKQIWEQGEDSIIMRWFYEDGVEKCHPYDHSEAITHLRIPLLLFTKNLRRVYFAATETDLEAVMEEWIDLGWSVEDAMLPTPIMRVYVDKPRYKGYVIIGDFEKLLERHERADSGVIQDEVSEYYCSPRDLEPPSPPVIEEEDPGSG